MEGFLFSGLFWGGILIIWGLSVMANAIFHFEIPIFRIIIAFVFVYVGAKMLMGGFRISGDNERNTVLFSDTRITYNSGVKDNEYNVIFGKGIVDLSGVPLKSGRNKIEVNAVFGEAVIEIDPETPVKIEANAAFAGAVTPDETITSFGKHTYQSANFNNNQDYLEIDANAVFGGLRFELKKK